VWLGFAVSPNHRVFKSEAQRAETAARNAAKNECETTALRTCSVIAVPEMTDVSAVGCSYDGRSKSFLGGSTQNAQKRIALDKANKEGYPDSSCVELYAYWQNWARGFVIARVAPSRPPAAAHVDDWPSEQRAADEGDELAPFLIRNYSMTSSAIREHARRNCQAERLGGLEVELKVRRRLNRKVSRWGNVFRSSTRAHRSGDHRLRERN
jgi:hypothetical protein